MAWWRKQVPDRVVVGVLGIVFGGALATWAGSVALDDHRARSWPVVDGIVLSSEILQGRGRARQRVRRVRVEYRYEIAGATYIGTRIRFGKRMSTRGGLTALRARYADGQRVDVHVDPDDPDRAVLQPGITGTTVGLGLLGVAFAAAGWMAVRGRSERRESRARGRRSDRAVIEVQGSPGLSPAQHRQLVIIVVALGFAVLGLVGGYIFLVRRAPDRAPPPPRQAVGTRPLQLSSVGLGRPVEGRFIGELSADTLTLDVRLHRVVLYATERLSGRRIAHIRAEVARPTPGASTWSTLGQSELVALGREIVPGDSLVLENLAFRVDRRDVRDLAGHALSFEVGLRPAGQDRVDRWAYTRSDTTLFNRR